MDGLLAVARLILAAVLVGSALRDGITGPPGLGRPGLTWPPGPRDVTRAVLACARIVVAVGLMFGALAWWLALSALAVLLAPVVPPAVWAGGDRTIRIDALSRITGALMASIPAAIVLLARRGGPDMAAWLAGLSPLRQVCLVGFAAALTAVAAGRLRPAVTRPPEAAVTGPGIDVSNPAAVAGPHAAPLALAADQLEMAAGPDKPPTRAVGAASLLRPAPQLTIGMATYDDFDGVYFTLQALRLYHDLTDTDLLVVDNYGCTHTAGLVRDWAGGRYVLATDVVGTAATKDLVFRHAAGNAVLCCDSHVLFVPGAIARLRLFHREHPDCADLLQGPLLYDDGRLVSTHFDPVWRGQMWGIWATDPRGVDGDGEPFEIPMQGLGAFSCRTDAWLGFHPGFRGFGGEEGYLHEKYRQAGRRCLCLPWLRWMHRFGRPRGPAYPLTVEDKLRNYVLGHAELGLDLAPVLAHFQEFLPAERVSGVAQAALAEAGVQ